MRPTMPRGIGGETALPLARGCEKATVGPQGRPGLGRTVCLLRRSRHAAQLPSPRRFLSHHAPARQAPDRVEDDPWAGEDVDWQAEGERRRDDPDPFARFFRAVAMAAVIGGLFWAGVVLLILRLL